MFMHPQMLTALATERRNDLIAENNRRHVRSEARKARRLHRTR
ncbi:hypothetical protein [Fodinicola feengrottensis]|uniref:Uncharacterized protein n=1 Tax=Fodinicola feengrottensis TaxID=435914 RepID=A0ABN2JD00_9ACTN|nr:hypothetical protein [Fodinicola feengrottensis]